jgi:hypothetical protein
MSLSRKYGRNGKTYHVTFSPGTDSTDRKNWKFWDNIVNGVNPEDYAQDKLFHNVLAQPPITTMVETEKFDGQGGCFNEYGVFARSHGAPSELPWDRTLRQKWSLIKNDLKDFGIEMFGENMYAVHSIEYLRLEHDFYCFAIRKDDMWLSWEEVEYFSEMFDFPTVPLIRKFEVEPTWKSIEDCQRDVEIECAKPSILGSIDYHTKEWCTKEGVVFRNADEYHVNNFVQNVFKWVRPGHVKTDEHWTRNWRPAFKKWELEAFAENPNMTPEQYRDSIIGLEAKRVKHSKKKNA